MACWSICETCPGKSKNCLRRRIDPLHSRGSGKPILNATIAPGGVPTRCPCCVAPKSRSQLPLWVKNVGSTRPTISRHVRCTSDSSRIGARGSPSLGARRRHFVGLRVHCEVGHRPPHRDTLFWVGCGAVPENRWVRMLTNHLSSRRRQFIAFS
jgi:hypothetical protein